MGVQFFFDFAKRKINQDFPNVFGGGNKGGGGKNRVSTVELYNKFIKPYGWLNSLYMVAEKGVFKKDGHNNIKIAGLSKLSNSKEIRINLYNEKLYKMRIK